MFSLENSRLHVSLFIYLFVFFSYQVSESESENRLRLNQCIEEAMMSFFLFLQEMSHFKEQNPGKVKLGLQYLPFHFTDFFFTFVNILM